MGDRECYRKMNADFQIIARRDKRKFLIKQCTEIEENNRKGNPESCSRKLELLKVSFMQRWTW